MNNSLITVGVSLLLLLGSSLHGQTTIRTPSPITTLSQPTTTSQITTISQTTTNNRQIVAPKRIDVPGMRFSLSTGQLFIPDYYQFPKSGKINLVVHFLGASWCEEQTFYPTKINAPLVTITVKDFTKAFSDTTLFNNLLKEIQYHLETTFHKTPAKIQSIALTSFSGGYPAIREILKTREYYRKITDVILADSLYCGFIDAEKKQLDEEKIQPFLLYATDASRGRKAFWFTHLYPPEEKYRENTTTLTAAYLIEKLKAKMVPREEVNTLGMRLLYSADKGNFHIRGYSGMTNQDHFNHLYNLGEYFQKIKFK